MTDFSQRPVNAQSVSSGVWTGCFGQSSTPPHSFARCQAPSSGTHRANLLSLPSEILNIIFFLSREPCFIQVCSRLHNVLPSFIWYSKRLAALAFYCPITNHVYSDVSIDLFPHNKLPGLLESISQEEQLALQARICASQWFTKYHLFIIRNEIMLKAIEEGGRILELIPPAEGWEVALKKAMEPMDEEGNGFDIDIALCCDGPLKTVGKVIVMGNKVHIVSPASKYTPWPWRMLPSNLRTNILTIRAIPAELITQVSKHNERAFDLLSTLFSLKTRPDAFDNANGDECFGISHTDILERAIRDILIAEPVLQESNDGYLKLLLEMHAISNASIAQNNATEIPDSCLITREHTEPKSKGRLGREAFKNHRNSHFLETAILEGDLIAFRRLMRLKDTRQFPASSTVRNMLRKAKIDKVPNATQMLAELEKPGKIDSRQKAIAKRRSIEQGDKRLR